MYRGQVCSICGVRVGGTYIVGGHNETPERHVNVECGTWDQLIAELQRMHNLAPEQTEETLRTLIRVTERYE